MIELKNTIEIGRDVKTLLAIDPSSMRTGCAVMDFNGKLLDMLFIKPNAADKPSDRILYQCADIRGGLDNRIFGDLTRIVIEGTAGKINKKRNKGQGAGMAVYGMAVGAMWMTCCGWSLASKYGCVVTIVAENDWTRGVPKKQRAINMSLLYPQYKPYLDPGLDVGDAIGLGMWWLNEQKMKG